MKNKTNSFNTNKNRYMEYQKLKQSEKKRKAKEIIEEYKQTNTT